MEEKNFAVAALKLMLVFWVIIGFETKATINNRQALVDVYYKCCGESSFGI